MVWYDAAAAGNVVTSPILDIVGATSYWAEGVLDSTDCPSSFRTLVVLTIEDCPNSPSMSVGKSGVFDDNNQDLIPQAGETISYIFSVTNTGDVPLTNITLSDPLPGIVLVGGPIIELLPGETDSTTFTATYEITETDIIAGEVVNQAFGESDEGATDESDDPNNFDDDDSNGDGEPDDPTITIIPNTEDVTFEIFNGVTPNGDGAHDYFQVLRIENWPINSMQIYNRWGVLVYETVGYGGSSGSENVFRGISEGRVTVSETKELPTGTYYYVLRFFGDNPGKSSYAGYLYINR